MLFKQGRSTSRNTHGVFLSISHHHLRQAQSGVVSVTWTCGRSTKIQRVAISLHRMVVWLSCLRLIVTILLMVLYHSPRLYYLVKTEAVTGIPYLWLSLLPIGGHYIESPCFGAYKADVISDKLVSRSGRVPKGGLTISQFWAKARANGNDYGLSCYDHRRLMMMLQLSEYGSPNCQAKIGYGVGGSMSGSFWSAASKLKTGATATLGDSCGSIPIDALADDTASKPASDARYLLRQEREYRTDWQGSIHL